MRSLYALCSPGMLHILQNQRCITTAFVGDKHIRFIAMRIELLRKKFVMVLMNVF